MYCTCACTCSCSCSCTCNMHSKAPFFQMNFSPAFAENARAGYIHSYESCGAPGAEKKYKFIMSHVAHQGLKLLKTTDISPAHIDCSAHRSRPIHTRSPRVHRDPLEHTAMERADAGRGVAKNTLGASAKRRRHAKLAHRQKGDDLRVRAAARPKARRAGPTIATRRWPRACARPIGVCRSACGRSDGTSLGSQARVDEGGPPPSTPTAAVGALPLIGGDVGASAAIGGADDAGGGVATSTVRMHTHAFG